MPHSRFDIKGVAAYLHVPVPDVQQLVHHQEIPFERQGNRIVFVRRDVDAWASQRILGFSHQRLEKYHKASSAQAHDLSRQHAIIAELTHRECIHPALDSRTRQSVLHDLVGCAECTGLLMYPQDLLTSLQERETLCSTGLPGGLALVHPRHHDPYMFGDSFVVLARTPQAIPFGASDGKPTDIFFLICCQDDRLHLHVLARLCMMCTQTKMVPALREAADGDAMFDAVAAAEDEIIRQL